MAETDQAAPVRTYHARRGRLSTSHRQALSLGDTWLLEAMGPVLDLVHSPTDAMWSSTSGVAWVRAPSPRRRPIPNISSIAIDVHTRGIATLLRDAEQTVIDQRQSVVLGDAVSFLDHRVANQSLSGARIYFPDPWPKARHAKRRLVQPAFVDHADGAAWRSVGIVHCATDDTDYAEQMRAAFETEPESLEVHAAVPADVWATNDEVRATRSTARAPDRRRLGHAYPLPMSEQDPSRPDLKPRSRDVTDGMERAPNRAMLRAVGFTDEDWDKPQIGVASSWNEITPCNLSLKRLAVKAKGGRVRRGRISRWSSELSQCQTASRWVTRECVPRW